MRRQKNKCITALKWVHEQLAVSRQNKSDGESNILVELNTLSFANLVPNTADEVILRLGNLFKSSNFEFIVATADTGLAILAEMEGFVVNFNPQK